MKRKVANVALAASILAGAGGAAVLATPMTALAADSTTTQTAQQTARTPGQWVTDALSGLVSDGTITQAQSDAVAAKLKDARPPGGGHGGPRVSMDKAAEVLGMSEADLHTALEQNKSLATIAGEKNVDVQKVIDALVNAENTQIDQQVTDGKLTQAQADERKAKTVERVTNMVNNVRPAGGPGGPGGKGGPGAPGADAPASAAPAAATAS